MEKIILDAEEKMVLKVVKTILYGLLLLFFAIAPWAAFLYIVAAIL